jgi:hypothetical protein
VQPRSRGPRETETRRRAITAFTTQINNQINVVISTLDQVEQQAITSYVNGQANSSCTFDQIPDVLGSIVQLTASALTTSMAWK